MSTGGQGAPTFQAPRHGGAWIFSLQRIFLSVQTYWMIHLLTNCNQQNWQKLADTSLIDPATGFIIPLPPVLKSQYKTAALGDYNNQRKATVDWKGKDYNITRLHSLSFIFSFFDFKQWVAPGSRLRKSRQIRIWSFSRFIFFLLYPSIAFHQLQAGCELVWCSFNFRFCTFQLPGAQKIPNLSVTLSTVFPSCVCVSVSSYVCACVFGNSICVGQWYRQAYKIKC